MKTVLVIEDDPHLREDTGELLELYGYNVLLAENGEVGINEATLKQPDIILCDIMMPILNGYEVLEALSKNKVTQTIPFIFLTAKVERDDIRKGMGMGADDYLTKPFTQEELVSSIESRIAKASLLREQFDQNNDARIKGDFETLKNQVLDVGEEVVLNAGETVYQEGSRADFIYLIYKGMVKGVKMNEKGKELVTSVYRDDDFFGLTTLIEETVYTESTVTMKQTEVYKLSTSLFKQMLNENSEAALGVIDYISNNISTVKQQLLDMAYNSVRKKTAGTIIQFSQKMMTQGAPSHVKITRGDLASVAGIAKESFIRALSDLRNEGLIEIEGRSIKILDLEGLYAIC